MDADRAAVERELNTTWAGITLLHELRLAQMRALLSEPLRAGTISREALAAEVGISPSWLDSFLDGAELREPAFTTVRKGCEGKPTPHVSPYLVAIGVLCHWFPARFVWSARAMLWTYVRRLADAHKARIPEFAAEQLDALYPLTSQHARGTLAAERRTHAAGRLGRP
jgi:hypothetical protein